MDKIHNFTPLARSEHSWLHSASVAFLGGLVAVMAGFGIVSLERASLWAVAFIVGFIAGFILFVRRLTDLFEWLVFYTVVQSLFIIIPLVYLAISGDFEGTYTWSSGFFADSSAIVLYTALSGIVYPLTFICVFIGYNMKLAEYIGSRLPVPSGCWSHRRVAAVIVILSLIGVFSYLRYMEQVGGWYYYVVNQNMRWILEYAANKYWRMGATMWPLASLIWLTYHFSHGGSRLVWVHTGLSIFIWTTFSGRGEIINMLLSIAILYHYTQRRLKIDQRTLLLLILSLSALVASSYLRNPVSPGDDLKLILVGNYGGLSSMAMLLKGVPEHIGLLWGSSLMEAFFMPVPRFLWSEKPIGIGHLVANIVWPGAAGGPALTSVEEFYLNFHLPGVFLGMMWVGFIGRVLYACLKNHPGHPGVVMLYATLIFWGGASVSGFIVGYGQRLIPLILVLLFLGRRRGGRES